MIPVSPVRRENVRLAAEISAAVSKVVESGDLILGHHGKEFEELWAVETGSQHCVGLASGLDALEAGLRSIGVAQGDVVVVPAMSAAATALAPLRMGALPLFADVDPATGLMDLGPVEEFCSQRPPSAVIPVALYGLRPQASTVRRLKGEFNVPVVMDMAQAHGSLDEEGNPEVPGQASAWSFYPTKNLGAIGDAGALTTDLDDVAERVRRWRNYGQQARYEHLDAGVNSRLDDVQAAVLATKKRYLSEWTSRRRAIAKTYVSAIDYERLGCLVAPEVVDRHALHQFVVLPQDRSDFVAFMGSRRVGTDIHYPTALPDQPVFRELDTLPRGAAHARTIACHAVSMPVHPFLTESEVDRIATALHEWCIR